MNRIYKYEINLRKGAIVVSKVPESRQVSPAIRSNDLTTIYVTKLL